jgi:hypothetical protein
VKQSAYAVILGGAIPRKSAENRRSHERKQSGTQNSLISADKTHFDRRLGRDLF